MLKFEHLEGRPFEPGKTHCYTMVRDIYRDNFGIELTDYAIPVDWDGRGLDLVELGFEREGFFKVYEWDIRNLNPGDVLAVAIRSENPNHLCVYVGGNTIIHHLYGQMSKSEMLKDFWRMTTCYLLRHKDVKSAPDKKPEPTFEELLRARYLPQAEA